MLVDMESVASRVKRLEAKGFRHMKGHGRYFAVPDFLDPEKEDSPWMFMHHPATLSASTFDELEVLVEAYDPKPFQTERLDAYRGHNIVRQGEHVYATPAWAGQVDFNDEDERRRFVSTSGSSLDEVRSK